MRRSFPLIALFAAPVLLLSSAALADNPCGNLELAASGAGQCEFKVTGCDVECTPINFTAACDGQCNANFDASCTGGCEADCELKCTPGSIDCVGSCQGSCYAGCDTTCSDSGCETECKASCDHRCEINCDVNPPDCQGACKVACDTTCTVKANVDCHLQCTSQLEGGCVADCQSPQGALFCDGQYVASTGTVDACVEYLKTHGFGVQILGSCDGNGCSATVGCATAPQIGALDERYAAGGIAGLMLAAGLFVSRRRRAQK